MPIPIDTATEQDPEAVNNATHLGGPPDLRGRLRRWLAQGYVQHTILALIIVNAVILGLETSSTAMGAFGGLLTALDSAILAVFVVEIALRIYVHRGAFFRDPWGMFDFAVVAIALVPASGPFAVLRALRVLRVLRTLTIVPSMKRVVGALLSAVPGLASIAGVLGLIFYVFAVIATKLFGASFPDWFGTMGLSLYTLFQVMTLESWSMGISRPVMEQYPYAWAFFVPFILVATFTMLNLFIAVIVSAMQTFQEAEHQEVVQAVDRSRDHIEADLHAEMSALRGEITALKGVLEQLTLQRGTGAGER
jgi:voltage-gated sodium channel